VLENGSHISFADARDKVVVDHWIDERRRLNEKAEDMIDMIRERPGFSRFLKTPSFSDLASAATRGLVVAVLATDVACFAVIIRNAGGETSTVTLPKGTLERLKKVTHLLSTSGMHDRGVEEHDQNRLGLKYNRTSADEDNSYFVLKELWYLVVSPVINELGLQVSTCLVYRRRAYLLADNFYRKLEDAADPGSIGGRSAN
jgi:hypothetical protein